MVSNQIRSSIRLFHSIHGIASFVTWVVYRSFKSTLRETPINSNRGICRREMMREDTTITLIKQSIQNFEETKDVEHLNDIIQIIFEYKKASNGTC